MPLVLNGATSGSTTIQATDAVTATLTLPSATGTLISTASSGQIIPSLALPAGTVLQVVGGTLTSGSGTIVVNNTSFATTTLSVSITPKSATSKIFVVANTAFNVASGTGQGIATIYRNSTNLGATTNGMTQLNLSGYWMPMAISYLDSPATTSSTTYSLYVRGTSSGNVYVNGDGDVSSITVMEIAA